MQLQLLVNLLKAHSVQCLLFKLQNNLWAMQVHVKPMAGGQRAEAVEAKVLAAKNRLELQKKPNQGFCGPFFLQSF